MKKLQWWALGILLVQFAFAGAWFQFAGKTGRVAAAVALLPAEVADADRIYIDAGESRATLQQQYGGKWLLPELHELPVDEDKIRDAVASLRGLKTSWPVATSSSGHERFEVGGENFQRRVQMFKGETLQGEIYFGSAPQFRQTHVRTGDDDNVYALEVNAQSFPAEDEYWMSKKLLAAKEISAFSGGGFSLEKDGDDWKLQNAGGEEFAADAGKVSGVTGALENLRVLALVTPDAGSEPPDNSEEGDAALPDEFELEVRDASGEWQYRFSRSGKDFRARRTDRAQSFTVSKSAYSRLSAASFAEFQSEAKAAEEDSAAE